METVANQFIFNGLVPMYRKLYWGQILNRKTTWEVKWIAVKSLWIIRGWK